MEQEQAAIGEWLNEVYESKLRSGTVRTHGDETSPDQHRRETTISIVSVKGACQSLYPGALTGVFTVPTEWDDNFFHFACWERVISDASISANLQLQKW